MPRLCFYGSHIRWFETLRLNNRWVVGRVTSHGDVPRLTRQVHAIMTPTTGDNATLAPTIWIVEPLESDEQIWQSILEISEFRRVKISTSADSLSGIEAREVGAVIVASSASDDDIRSLHGVLEARGYSAPVVRWNPARVEELRARWSSVET